MHRILDWRIAALAMAASGALPLPPSPSASTSPSTSPSAHEQLDGTWLLRNLRWRAPSAQTSAEQADPRRRASETYLVDLQLELRQIDDSLWGRLTNLRDPEDVRWQRALSGVRVGDSVYLSAPAGPGRPNLQFEGIVASTRLTGRLNVPPRSESHSAQAATQSPAVRRQVLPEWPARDEWLPVQFWRAPE